MFLHARTLPIYARLARATGQTATTLCVGTGDFLVASARNCQQRADRVRFIESRSPAIGETATQRVPVRKTPAMTMSRRASPRSSGSSRDRRL